MHLVGVARRGPDLRGDLCDRCRIERPDPARVGGRERAPDRDGPRATLLERRVVEVRPGAGVEELVRERRGLRRVHRHEPDVAVGDPLEHGAERARVHRLAQAVTERLVHERVIGHGDRPAGRVVLAGDLRREHRGEQVLGAHPGDRRGHALALEQAGDGERARRVPAPAHAEHRRLERRLDEHLVERRRRDVGEDRLEGERVLRPERKEHPLVRRGGLQLEVERPAEALAQREPEGAVRCARRRARG